MNKVVRGHLERDEMEKAVHLLPHTSGEISHDSRREGIKAGSASCSSETSAPQDQVSIGIIGFGGFGINAISYLVEEGRIAGLAPDTNHVQFACIATNTDLSLSTTSDHKIRCMNIPLEMVDSITESTLNIGSKDMDQLQAAISGIGILFLVADFREKNWAGVMKSLAKAAENMGVPIMAIIQQYEPEEFHRNEESGSAIENFSDTSFPILFLPRMLVTSNESTPKELSCATHEAIFQAIQGVSTLITYPGFIGVDMADIRSIFASGRYVRVGSGVGMGEKAMADALTEALNAPMLGPSVLYEAKGILLNLTAGPDLHMEQFEEAVETLQSMTNPHSLLIAGIPLSQAMEQGVRVTIMCVGE